MPGQVPSDSERILVPPVKIPPPPPDLSPLAREIWSDLVPGLAEYRLLTSVDIPALALMAEAMAEYQQVRKILDDEGRYFTVDITNKQGDVLGHRRQRHPAIQDLQTLNDRIQAWLVEFGMTPSSRAKIAFLAPVDRDTADSSLEELTPTERETLRALARTRVGAPN